MYSNCYLLYYQSLFSVYILKILLKKAKHNAILGNSSIIILATIKTHYLSLNFFR